ncbi:response regulator [Larkinella humicola]|uniref:Response regulator n=2 Tax=Larkinella humicola TaxID=2607654 RepID=A0A5N1JBT9_9BACT|nr:response regulator [Larkinella humicola]
MYTCMNRVQSNRDRNLRNARILVVEDNLDQGIVIRKALQQTFPDAQLVQVDTPEHAISYLEELKDCEWNLPKLIIQDLYMPQREDGWQILDAIRHFPMPICMIPVIMLSSSDHPDDIREAYERGSSCYVVKPFAFDQWLERFDGLRQYWWNTASLPTVRYSF